MGNHDDEAVFGDLLDDVHDLDGSLGIEGPGRLVRKQDFRIAYDGAGDGYSLTLAARKLIRLLVIFAFEPNLVESRLGFRDPFFASHPANRQSQLDILENGLMRNEIVALENESNPVVAVIVPIAVFKILGRYSVDEKIARGIVVKAADDVEKSRLAASGRAEYGNEFVAPELDGETFQGVDKANVAANFVILLDVD